MKPIIFKLILLILYSIKIFSQSIDTINLTANVQARPLVFYRIDSSIQIPDPTKPNFIYLTDDVAISNLKNFVDLAEKYYHKDLINTERLKNCKELEEQYDNLVSINEERIKLYRSSYEEQRELFNNLSIEFDKLKSQKTWKPWIKGLGSGLIVAFPIGIIAGIIIAHK